MGGSADSGGTGVADGHYVVDDSGAPVRVVECDRHNPTSSRVFRLLSPAGDRLTVTIEERHGDRPSSTTSRWTVALSRG